MRKLRGKSQGGAPGGEEEDRREGGTRGSPARENLAGGACRDGGV
jgi:hypothetical protein